MISGADKQGLITCGRMGRWSGWRTLYHDDGTHLKPSEIEFHGPVAYILAVPRRRSEKHTLYVGSTNNLKTRLYGHSYGDDTTWRAFDEVWENGYKVWYSVHTTRSIWQARRIEENTRSEWWLYPLNDIGNPTRNVQPS